MAEPKTLARSLFDAPERAGSPQPARQQPQESGFDPGITDDDVPF